MRNIEITLYDIFGYLIPGCVALLGIYLIAWRIVLPVNQDWNNVSTVGWAVIVGVAYVIGHLVHSLSNILCHLGWKNPEQRILLNSSLIPSNVVHLAQKGASRVIGLSENDSLDVKTLYDVMDHYIQQHGRTESRDIYVYREGFYRGLSVGLCLLAIGSLIHMMGVHTTIAVSGVNFTVTKAFMGFAAILSVIMALFGFARYRRFVIYRVKNCLFSFLTTCKIAKKGGLQC
jgi:hypothetical protein